VVGQDQGRDEQMGDDPLVAQHTGRTRAWESSHFTHF
jgi:hypothetical protein